MRLVEAAERSVGGYLGALPGRARSANEMIDHKGCGCMLQLEVDVKQR